MDSYNGQISPFLNNDKFIMILLIITTIRWPVFLLVQKIYDVLAGPNANRLGDFMDLKSLSEDPVFK